MKKYVSKFSEASSPNSRRTARKIGEAIQELYDDALEYSDDEMEAIQNISEEIGDTIHDCLYDMFGPDTKLHNYFKQSLIKYIK